MICAKTDNKAMELAEDMKWMREKWVVPFGQPFPELVFGSPETLNIENRRRHEKNSSKRNILDNTARYSQSRSDIVFVRTVF